MKSFIRVQDKHGRGMFQYGNQDNFQTAGVYDIPDLQDLAERHLEFPNLWLDKKLVKFLEGKLGKNFEANKFLTVSSFFKLFNRFNSFGFFPKKLYNISAGLNIEPITLLKAPGEYSPAS